VADIVDSGGGGRLRTGVDALDRELDGGLPPGSVVAYCAPPASQSELLLYELTSARDTMYVSTDRTEDLVADAFDRALCPTGDPDVRYVAGDTPLEHARRLFRSIRERQNLVIDPTDSLERQERSRYQAFLNELGNHMANTESIAVLHCLRGDATPELRSTTQHMADVVFELSQEYNGSDVETRLAVPKFRGGNALNETIKLELADRIRVDTSRDIA